MGCDGASVFKPMLYSSATATDGLGTTGAAGLVQLELGVLVLDWARGLEEIVASRGAVSPDEPGDSVSAAANALSASLLLPVLALATRNRRILDSSLGANYKRKR